MEYHIDLTRLQQYGPLEMLARQVVEGFITGLHKSPFHGFSVEFAEHRLYNSGESTRHIDWKLFGRTDRLYVKRYEEETNLRCRIIIDQSSSMFYPVIAKPTFDNPNKITFSIYGAAAIITMLKKQRDAVGLSLFDDEIRQHTIERSSSIHVKYLFGLLENLMPPISSELQRTTNAALAIHEIAEKIHKRSLVVIFSDMFDSYKNQDEVLSALQHLRHNKHEVILFHVSDRKKEFEFEFENRPYKFIDMESGNEVKVRPMEVKDKYIEAVSNFYNELKLKCGQYQIDFVEADINKGFDQILLPYLLKRQKLY